jgi:hypothetical protein
MILENSIIISKIFLLKVFFVNSAAIRISVQNYSKNI